MKLLNKSTLYYLLFLLPVLVISGFIFYSIIDKQVDNNIDEALLAQKKLIESRFVLKNIADLHFYNDDDDDVIITILNQPAIDKNTFLDVSLYDSTEEEMVPFRQLKSSFSKNGKNFGIVITRSNIKGDELAESISIALIFMFGLLLIVFLFVNRFISRKLFNPFYESLEKLNTISFSHMESNPFGESSTKEFSQLNSALNKMTEKMFNDFNNQKQFTENASHELQTPLAVIKSQVDLLIQSKTVSANDMEQIAEIEKSVSKLSQLNKSLLLLSKIENRQFDGTAPVEISTLVEKILSNFEDYIKLKNILLKKEYSNHPLLQINPLLSEILFSNLIQNATRYNFENGVIEIRLTDDYFSIANSGHPLDGNEQKLFNRFAKFSSAAESLGLGLAIVKQVCDYYNFAIRYSRESNLHYFRVDFNPQEK